MYAVQIIRSKAITIISNIFNIFGIFNSSLFRIIFIKGVEPIIPINKVIK